jgi:urea transport system permease protein
LFTEIFMKRAFHMRAWISFALVWALGASQWAMALTPEQAYRMAAGDSDERIAAIAETVAAATKKPDERLPVYLQALLDDAVKFDDKLAYVVVDDQAQDAVTGQPATPPDTAEDVSNNNRLRGALQNAIAALDLASSDLDKRKSAIEQLKGNADEAILPILREAQKLEKDPALADNLNLLVAGVMLKSQDPALRKEAAKTLSEGRTPDIRAVLEEQLLTEADPAVKSALQMALSQVEGRLVWGERIGVLFSGVSLGSILLLAALGLAINYGLMGVINMAHGEMMMIGAYATYMVQNLFRTYLGDYFDAYLLAAIPASFLVAAAVGAVLERTVIRWLYGRPLETLLATWGISLVLMQGVRTLFGAQNVQVENPVWLSGGVEVLGGVVLPYNRIGILVFAALVLLGMGLLMSRTRLGLYVRSVTQNRSMAACVGVHTKRVDTLAFSLGAGLAGLAGCALSQIGNVGPDLGQNYIVDSFMVVVLGGVGQLAGTVYAALGLGLLNKLLEGWAGAVLAKIMVLVIIVVFIQKRPQGLFAMKGRSAEA